MNSVLVISDRDQLFKHSEGRNRKLLPFEASKPGNDEVPISENSF